MIVTFDTIPESKILDTGDISILSNLQKSWMIACKDVDRIFKLKYSTYHVLNRSELGECSLTAGNYLWRYARSKRQLLHNILCLQQDSTRSVNGEIQHTS